MPTLAYASEANAATAEFLGPSDWEQLQLELINRARANPDAEAARQGTSLGTGVSPNASQPLAIVPELDASAQGHANDMLAQNFFAHVNPFTGKSPFTRMMDAGYTYDAAAENIGWIGAFSSPYNAARIQDHHNNLWNSLSHRQAFMSDTYTEVGFGFATGPYTHNGTTYPESSMMAQNFGDRGHLYLTGVIIDDTDNDAFYDIGEGQGGVTVTATNAYGSWTTTSWNSGGYALRLPSGTYTVIFASGELQGRFQTTVTIDARNVKLDVIEDRDTSPAPATATAQANDLPQMAGLGNAFRPGDTAESLSAAGAEVHVSGAPNRFEGDMIFDFGAGDQLVFEGVEFDEKDFHFNKTDGSLNINGSGASANFNVHGNFADAGFMLFQKGGNTQLKLVENIAGLRENGRLSNAAINGIAEPEYLMGDNADTFTITIDAVTASKFANALGVYEITPGGDLVDVLILAQNAKNGGTFTITDVDTVNQLGFFIIQNGGNQLGADILSSADLELLEVEGTARLFNNGEAVAGATVFVSHDADLNPDNRQHVASGLAQDGSGALVVGFEDSLRNGNSDDDFQDVAFRVQADFDFV